jgi:hypothetical protein
LLARALTLRESTIRQRFLEAVPENARLMELGARSRPESSEVPTVKESKQ